MSEALSVSGLSPSARVVLATRNSHKLQEMRAILEQCLAGEPAAADLHTVVVSLEGVDAPEVVESGVTFADNALLKARAAAAVTGLPAVADDSGLAVDVLGGAPGVFSARWSGRHGDDRANVDLLLGQLGDVPAEHRGAGFVCAMALVTPEGRELVRHGELRGTLTTSPRGLGGFGYDPVLQLEGDSRTLAELAPDEKNEISHRSQALRALAPEVLRLLH
jgi:XTP/dITP diphosphohydrolase